MNKISLSRLLAGGGIILFGVAALLGSFDIINFRELFSTYWPVLLIAGGLITLFTDTSKNYLWAIILIVGGSVMLLNSLDVLDVNFWQLFWPVVIIGVGASIIFKRDQLSVDSSGATTAVLSGFDAKNNTKDYKGGKITAILGGGVLDLRKATIKKEATIDMLAVMGGVELRVPEEWDVRVSITGFLGGSENTAVAPREPNAPILNIVGTAIMGGIEIKN